MSFGFAQGESENGTRCLFCWSGAGLFLALGVSGVRIDIERATVHWNQEDAPLSWFRASVSRFALKQLCGA